MTLCALAICLIGMAAVVHQTKAELRRQVGRTGNTLGRLINEEVAQPRGTFRLGLEGLELASLNDIGDMLEICVAVEDIYRGHVMQRCFGADAGSSPIPHSLSVLLMGTEILYRGTISQYPGFKAGEFLITPNVDSVAGSVWRQIRTVLGMTAGILLLNLFIYLPVRRALSNSAGVLAWPAAHHDWIRPGIMLYGVTPMLGRTGADDGLKPVMTLNSALIAVKRLQAGDPVGYSGIWHCPQDVTIGVVAMGYADGYPRHAPTGTPILVNGRETQVVGRVSMDMLCVDLGNQPGARIGDPVTLWGKGLPAERVAEAAGTIAYEMFCNLAARVRVEVTGH